MTQLLRHLSVYVVLQTAEHSERAQLAQYVGKVAWFNNAKGYGFLSREGGGQDVFVHYSAIMSDGYRELKEGDLVEFDIENGTSGKQQAANVKRRTLSP